MTVNFIRGTVTNPGDAWLRPVSNTSFDASVSRLISAQVTLDSTEQNKDQLYFTGLVGSSHTDSVVYTFQAVGIGSTSIVPYQQASSGNQRKFSPLPSAITVTGNAFQHRVSRNRHRTSDIQKGD